MYSHRVAIAGAAALLLTAPFAGCMFMSRALTYPFEDPVMDVTWYRPMERVRGGRAPALAPAAPSVTGMPEGALDRASRYARRMESCALLVLHRRRVILERYWCGAGPETRPNAMSMAKGVAALLLGVAHGQGLVGPPHTPAARYLPEWSGGPRRAITLEHLLQMASGLRNSGSPFNPFSDIARLHLGSDVRGVALAIPAAEAPGQRFQYNNANTQVLALVLERATGRRYADYLSRELWRPLGAADGAVWLDEEGGGAKAYCCLFARARDWARLGQMMVDGGRVGDRQVVPAAWIARMLTPSALEPSFGYGLWLGRTWSGLRRKDWREPFVARDTFMLVGQGEQRVFGVPSHELVIVRLGREAGPDWDDTVIPNLLVRALGGSA